MSRLERWADLYERVLLAVAGAGGVVLLALIGAISVDVLLRNLAGTGVRGIVEFTEFGLYGATIAAAPWLLHRGQHIRTDVLLQTLPPKGTWIMEIVADLLGLLVTAILLVYAVRVTQESLALRSMVRKTIIFPEWWLMAPLPLALALCIGAFAFRLARLRAGPQALPATRGLG